MHACVRACVRAYMRACACAGVPEPVSLGLDLLDLLCPRLELLDGSPALISNHVRSHVCALAYTRAYSSAMIALAAARFSASATSISRTCRIEACVKACV